MKKILLTILIIVVAGILSATTYSNMARYWISNPSADDVLMFDSVSGQLRIVNTDTLDLSSMDVDTLQVDFLNSNDSTNIELLSDLLINSFETTTNPGAVTVFNAPVDDDADDGDEMSMGFAIDGTTVLKVGAEADGSGGVDTEFISINGAKIYANAITLDDDEEIAIKTGVAGFGQVYGNEEWMHFHFQDNGVTTKINGTANTAATDSDTDLCVYGVGDGIEIANRLGDTYKVLIKITYMTP